MLKFPIKSNQTPATQFLQRIGTQLFNARLRNFSKFLFLYSLRNPKSLDKLIFWIISQTFWRDNKYLPPKTLWPCFRGCLITQRWYFAGSEFLCLLHKTQKDGLEALCYGKNHKTIREPKSNTLNIYTQLIRYPWQERKRKGWVGIKRLTP